MKSVDDANGIQDWTRLDLLALQIRIVHFYFYINIKLAFVEEMFLFNFIDVFILFVTLFSITMNCLIESFYKSVFLKLIQHE